MHFECVKVHYSDTKQMVFEIRLWRKQLVIFENRKMAVRKYKEHQSWTCKKTIPCQKQEGLAICLQQWVADIAKLTDGCDPSVQCNGHFLWVDPGQYFLINIFLVRWL